MDSEKPEKIAINHDDYHAEHIGRTKLGHQFFLTAPFVPAHRCSGFYSHPSASAKHCNDVGLFL